MRAGGAALRNAALIATFSASLLARAASLAGQETQPGDGGSLARAVANAILLGAAGALAGSGVSEFEASVARVRRNSTGFMLDGLAFGMALGAHLGNGGRGRFRLDLAVAALGVMTATMASAGEIGSAVWITGNVAAALITATVEVRSGRRRPAPVQLLVEPDGSAMRLGLSIRTGT